MAVSVGELVAHINADPSGMTSGLARAELAMRGFQVDTEGRLRHLNGRFASTAEQVSLGLGHVGQSARHASRAVGDIDRDSNRARAALARIGSAAGALAGVAGQAGLIALKLAAVIPVAAGLAAALVNIAPAAAVGASAVFALGSALGALKVGTSGVGAALSAVFAGKGGGGGGGGGGGATGAAKAHKAALEAVKDATEQAALANQRAARQVEDAERGVADAQKAAKRAQEQLTQAREDATRELEDMNNSLDDARLSQRQAVLDLHDAEKELARVRAMGAEASADEIEAAQLGYDKAVEALDQQQTETKRLEKDTKKANDAGVEGSKTYTDAQQDVADAQRDVADAVRALKDAQEEQSRTAAEGLKNIKRAQDALNDATSGGGGGGGGGLDPLAEALKKLSPNARAFVQEIIRLKPALDALKLKVQDALFKGLAGELRTTASAVLPILEKNLVSSAGALNKMAKGVGASARELASNGTLGQALSAASQGLHNLSGIPGMVLKSFTQFAAAAGPSFERLTSALGQGAERLGDKLSKSFASGRMQESIERAIDLIGQLMAIGVNVGRILGGIFDAADESGGSFLDTLQTITGAIADAVNSPEVQGGLKALFGTFGALAKEAAPLLIEALKQLAPVFTALGPPAKILISALGDALKPIIKALGPVLVAAATAVGDLVEAFAPLLPVLGELIADLLPPLTPVFKTISQVAKQLAPVIAQLAAALGPTLTPIIEGLADVIVELVTNNGDLIVQLVQELAPAIPQLVPLLIEMGKSFGKILEALAPLLPDLTELATMFILQLLPALLPLLPPLIELATKFLNISTMITVHVLTALDSLIDWFKEMERKLQPAIDAVKKVTEWIRDKFQWLYDVLVGHSIVPDMINKIVGWFAGLPRRAYDALASLGSNIAGRASAAGTSMVNAIKSRLDSAVSWIRGLPSRASKALGNLGSVLYNSGRALIRGFIDGMGSMWSGVTSTASSLMRAARDYFPFSPAKKGPFSGKGWVSYSGEAIGKTLAASMAQQQGLVGASANALMTAAQQGLAADGTPMGNLTASPAAAGATGYGPGGSAAGAGRSGKPPRMIVEFRGGQDKFTQFVKELVRVDFGGDVQSAFGQ
ncbi:hypothetical protein ABZ883_14935 [Streptomyces sp. NPDC046977]|uniref:hypothetical protein n=1 Tax=Streptomyces sp. NPDC046977 TaxID=3154703 RepID=UPI0033C17C61